MSTFPSSKKEMFAELDRVLLFELDRLGFIFGEGAGHRVLNWPMNVPLSIWVNSTLSKAAEENGQSLDLSGSRLCQTLDAAFDYAQDGTNQNLDLDDGPESALGLASGWVADFECSATVRPLAGSEPITCEKLIVVLESAQARAVLDRKCMNRGRFFSRPSHPQNPEWLTFREVALLARVEERSVRNAASAKELETVRDDTRTYVHVDAARKWLSGRRGFIPSKRERGFADHDLFSRPFVSLIEWQMFLSDRSKALGVFDTQLLDVAHRAHPEKKLKDLNGFFPESEEEIRKTSQILELNWKILALRLNELLLSKQLEETKESIQKLAAESKK